MSTLLETFRAARLRGVPIVGISTPDQPATIQALRESENGKAEQVPLFRWDCMLGCVPLNTAGELTLRALLGFTPETYNPKKEEDVLRFQSALRKATREPENMLEFAARLPGADDARGAVLGSVLFVQNAHLFLAESHPNHAMVRQAVANLRDRFKGNSRMLVLLAPELTLPVELAQDSVPLHEPYPDAARLAEIVREQCRGVGLPEPDAETLLKATDALLGCTTFTAEQITAMSLRKTGLDIAALRERKYAELEKSGVVKVDRERLTFADIGGMEQIKKRLRGEFESDDRPAFIWRLDEIEKFMAASQSDSSGVSQDQEGVLLKAMEDNKWDGIIFVSPPGCGKTELTKAVAGEFDTMGASADLGATKDKWVGASEKGIRNLVKLIEAAAGPRRVLIMATCNKLEAISPAMRRRFTIGIWYNPIPTAEIRERIWPIQLRKHGLPLDMKRPDDAGWTGADIRNCCRTAARLKCSLAEASEYLVPVSRSDPKSVEALERLAQGTFLCTEYLGVYMGPGYKPVTETVAEKKPAGRRVRLGEN
jgi:ATPase family associated with various cellular activities (AAA)